MNAQMETLLLSIIKIDKVIIGILLLQSIILEIVICRSALSLSLKECTWHGRYKSSKVQTGRVASRQTTSLFALYSDTAIL